MSKKNITVTDDYFAQYEGAGMQNVTAEHLLIPRITIIQKLSPQLSRSKSEFIKTATEGQICNVATSEVFDEMLFVPVLFREDFIEWAPRDSGRGIVKIHEDKSILDECDITANGKYMHGENLVVNTGAFFGWYLPQDGKELNKCFLSMAGVQWKKGRKLLTLASSIKLVRKNGSKFTPPLWYMGYKMTTQPESNVQGEWYGWSVEMGKSMTDITKQLKLNIDEVAQESISFESTILDTQRALTHEDTASEEAM